MIKICNIQDKVQLAGYYNLILPSSERYLSPVQSYLTSLLTSNLMLRSNRNFLLLRLPRAFPAPTLLTLAVALESLQDPFLAFDFVELAKELPPGNIARLYAITAIAKLPANYQARVDPPLKSGPRDDTALDMINGAPFKFSPYFNNNEYFLAGQYGVSPDAVTAAFPVLHYMLQVSDIINGYILGNHVDSAIKIFTFYRSALDIRYVEKFDFSLFYFTDALEYYQLLENWMLSLGVPQDWITGNILSYALSIVNIDSVLTPGKIFNYVFNSTNFNTLDLRALNHVLMTKSYYDFMVLSQFCLLWIQRLGHKLIGA